VWSSVKILESIDQLVEVHGISREEAFEIIKIQLLNEIAIKIQE